MGLGKVIFNTLIEFGSHTTIGGLCNAGISSSGYRKVSNLTNSIRLDSFTIESKIIH